MRIIPFEYTARAEASKLPPPSSPYRDCSLSAPVKTKFYKKGQIVTFADSATALPGRERLEASWRPGWTPTVTPEYLRCQRRLLRQPRWEIPFAVRATGRSSSTLIPLFCLFGYQYTVFHARPVMETSHKSSATFRSDIPQTSESSRDRHRCRRHPF